MEGENKKSEPEGSRYLVSCPYSLTIVSFFEGLSCRYIGVVPSRPSPELRSIAPHRISPTRVETCQNFPSNRPFLGRNHRAWGAIDELQNLSSWWSDPLRRVRVACYSGVYYD